MPENATTVAIAYAPEYVVSMNYAYVTHAGGVQDFAANLVRSLAGLLPGRLTVVQPSRALTRRHQVAMRYLSELLLELRYWRRRAIVLFPNYFIVPLPFSRLKRVVVVHDLQFKHYPQYTSALKRLVLDVSYRWARRCADGVVFISAATRDDFLAHYGSPRAYEVIYNPIALDVPSGRTTAPDGPYVVANFHYYPHKNVARLLRLFQGIRAEWPELKLVLTGHRPPDLDRLAGGNAVELGIYHLGYLPKADVIAVVRDATFFMSLSQFEGFNMSAAEAALLGKPLVLSDIPVHREIFGDAALLVDQEDELPIARILDYVKQASVAIRPWSAATEVAPQNAAQHYLDFMMRLYG